MGWRLRSDSTKKSTLILVKHDSDYVALITYFQQRVELSSQEIDAIKSAYTLQKIKKKEFVFQQGEICTAEAFILAGTFRVFYCDEKGLEHVLYFGIKDWWVGDMASFYSNEISNVSAQALEDGMILTIDPAKKEQLFQQVPSLERVFRIITQKHLTVMQKRFLLTISAKAKERYEELIQRSPGIEQLVPQHQIASYLGILPESLSRMKKQIQKS